MIRWAKKHQIPLRPRGGPSLKQSRIALTQAAAAPSILRPALSRNGGRDRLRRFAAVAAHPTLACAAKALGLHPPFLSPQISQLENDIGGQLLVRAQRGHSMQLTPLGREVVAAVRKCSPEEMPPH
ncbi:MAG: helix-turn-helix domain-containing protein [Sciscionella sp.]